MENFLSEFEAVDKQTWLNKVEADAKGNSIAEFDWKVNGLITQSPFINSEDATVNYSSIKHNRNTNHWNIGEQIVVKDIEQSNKQILAALENGISSLFITMEGGVSRADFDLLFKQVNFTYIDTYFDIKDELVGKSTLENLIRFCKQESQDLAEVVGGIYQSEQTSFQSIKLLKDFGLELPQFSFASVSTDKLFGYSNTVVHEVGSLLLGLVNILEADTVQNQIFININIGVSYLLNISKVRAIHILMNNLLKIYESKAVLKVNAQISDQSLTTEENHNLIQFTSQAMSSVIGGVSSLVLPASDKLSAVGASDFRKRLSRNTQSIMQMESFMNKVVDPAAGSYYIEKLTEQIAEQSWAYIQNHS